MSRKVVIVHQYGIFSLTNNISLDMLKEKGYDIEKLYFYKYKKKKLYNEEYKYYSIDNIEEVSFEQMYNEYGNYRNYHFIYLLSPITDYYCEDPFDKWYLAYGNKFKHELKNINDYNLVYQDILEYDIYDYCKNLGRREDPLLIKVCEKHLDKDNFIYMKDLFDEEYEERPQEYALKVIEIPDDLECYITESDSGCGEYIVEKHRVFY